MSAAEGLDDLRPVSFVRTATPDDIPFILAQESRPEHRERIFAWTEAKHREAITDPARRYRVMQEADGSLSGYAILSNLTTPRPTLVRLVAAEPGTGIGAALLSDAIDRAFESPKAKALYLDVFPDNARAIALYVRFGFKEAIALKRATTINGKEKPLLVMVLERP